jgi:hypothetical protein
MTPFEHQPTAEWEKHDGAAQLGCEKGGQMAMSLYPRCDERG